VIIPLLGLAGEVGELLSEVKKKIRDRGSYKLFDERVKEELGDLLWYVANVATKFGLDLEEVAASNLAKASRRWTPSDPSGTPRFFDSEFPEAEQLPRAADITLTLDKQGRTRMAINGKRVGAKLTDNRDEEDGYRFHDVFHLSYMAVLGWSPIIRRLMGRKRRSIPRFDEVEDGGRAAVIEEGIAAMVFSYVEQDNWFEAPPSLRYDVLRTIKQMTQHLEVKARSEGEWENAILQGFDAWNAVKEDGGRLKIDMASQTLQVVGVGTSRAHRTARRTRQPSA
jgi:NTP pyrophosphatase (non-canonical NTP hydrolase)